MNARSKSTPRDEVVAAEVPAIPERVDADAALRAAAKAAIDAGNFARAAALLAMLHDEPTTTVVDARKRFGRK